MLTCSLCLVCIVIMCCRVWNSSSSRTVEAYTGESVLPVCSGGVWLSEHVQAHCIMLHWHHGAHSDTVTAEGECHLAARMLCLILGIIGQQCSPERSLTASQGPCLSNAGPLLAELQHVRIHRLVSPWIPNHTAVPPLCVVCSTRREMLPGGKVYLHTQWRPLSASSVYCQCNAVCSHLLTSDSVLPCKLDMSLWVDSAAPPAHSSPEHNKYTK